MTKTRASRRKGLPPSPAYRLSGIADLVLVAADPRPLLSPSYAQPIADVTHKRIDEIDPIDGFIDGFDFRPARAALGVSPFGMNIIEMPAGATGYPAHDHSSEGPGNPPAHQLGQEEVYVALRGSAEVEVEGRRYPVDADHILRVGPTARRKILPGPDGVRLLALSGKPGEAYDPDSH